MKILSTMKRIRIQFYLSLLILILINSFSLSEADLPGWSYSAVIGSDNSSGGALTNYQILVNLDTQTLITAGKMNSDCSDIRFLDSDDATQLSYWIESGANTSSTLIWVEVPTISAASTKNIYMYYGNSGAAAVSSMTDAMVLGEIGIATVSANYSTVNLSNTYTNPIIVASPVEGSDNEEVSSRIRNVGVNSFDVKLHHPSGTAINADTVYYLAVEEGQLITLDDILIEADSYTETNVIGRNSGDNNWGSFSFNHTYSSSPVVFTQAQTENDAGWISEALVSVSTTGTNSAMERAEVAGDHGDETIGWIAMETGQTGLINSINFETTTSGNNVLGHSNGTYSTSFTQTFSSAPLVITDMRTRDGGDGGWVVIDSITTTALNQHIEEDREGDADRSHTSEDTSIIGLENAGSLVFRKYTSTEPAITIYLSASELVFTTSEQSVVLNQNSRVITVEALTEEGSSAYQVNNTTLNLSTSSAAGQFSASSSPFIPVSQVTIPAGSSSVNFYYKDTTPGVYSITALESPSQGWTDATQSMSILTYSGQTVEDDMTQWANRVPVEIDNSSGGVLTEYQTLIILNTVDLISAGDMNGDGDDIRFMDSDDTTQLPYWIESGINTTQTRIWVKVPNIPASGSKNIYFYYGNNLATATSTMDYTMVMGESGTAAVSSAYNTVNFLSAYTDPIIVASYIEGSDDEEVSVRIKDIGAYGFEAKLHHPSGSTFNSDTINYFVMESGQHITLDGVLIEAGSYTETHVMGNASGDNSWGSFSFSHAYLLAPVVFSQVLTENDTGWITEGIANVTTNGVSSSMERAEVTGDHADEIMGWIAIETDKTGTLNSVPFETTTSGDNVLGHSNGNYTTSFNQSFTSAPIVITDMRRRDGNNGGWTAIESISTTELSQHIEEDRVGDTERSHTTEDTSIIAFESSSKLPFRKFADPVPTTSLKFPITQLAFTTPATTVYEDRVSSAITIQTQDFTGSPQNVSSDITVNLTTTSLEGDFSLTSTPFSPVTTVTIPSGSNSVDIYYRDSIVGTPTISAVESPDQGWTDAVQTVTVGEVILVGRFKMPFIIDNTSNPDILNEYQVLITVDTQTLISEGKMNADGSDIRFLDSNEMSQLYYWIESGINTNSTRIWVRVPQILASSFKTIYMYYGSLSASSAANLARTMDAEVNSVSVGSNWTTINLDGYYTNPVIVANYECDGGEESAVRIRNVSSDSFDIRLQNAGDRNFSDRTVHFFVVEETNLLFLDGTLIEGHNYTETHTIGGYSGDNTWNTISFDHSYTISPVVFSQVTTYSDSNFVFGHISNVTTATARSAMDVGQLSFDHGDETMSWITVERSRTGNLHDIPYETGTSGDSVLGHNNGCYSTSFTQIFSQPPATLVDLRKRDGGDGGWASICALSSTALSVHVEEEDESDGERSHTTEDVSFLAFDSTGPLAVRKYSAVEPTVSQGAEETVVAQIGFNTLPQVLIQGRSSLLMTVETQDYLGSPKIVPADTQIELTTSSIDGNFASESSPSSWSNDNTITLTILAGESSASFYYIDQSVGNPVITASEYPSQGFVDATQQQTVNPSVNTFLIESEDIQIAGAEFTLNITAIALDGSVSTLYTDSVNITVNYISPDSGRGTLSITTTSSFVNGVASLTNQTFSDCGTITITVTKADDAAKTGTSNNIKFVPYDFDVVISELDADAATGSNASHTVNKPFRLTATARNSSGATCQNYEGTANLTVDYVLPSSDQSGNLNTISLGPDDWTNGVSEKDDISYDKWGIINIVVQDNTRNAQKGISNSINFIPRDFKLTLSDPPISRTFYYVDEDFKLSVQSLDFNGAAITNYQGTVNFIGSEFILPEKYTFSSSDYGIHTFSGINCPVNKEKTKISVNDDLYSYVKGETDLFTVKDASIKVFSNYGPVGDLAVTIAIVDTDGDIIAEDDSTMFRIKLEEIIDDNSASSETVINSSIMGRGKSSIIVNNNQAESVTINPVSTPKLKSISGTATFGTVSRTGLGIQIYRELKEEGYEE